MTKQAVITQALKLTEAERIEVAEALFESLAGPEDPDAETAWAAEVQRRIQQIDNGRARLIPWEQGRKQILGEADGATPD